SPSLAYAKAHIPGAWFAMRSRLVRALTKIAPRGEVVLTSENGILAALAVAERRLLTDCPVRALRGGNAAWQTAGFALSSEARMADEALDIWLKPYERPADTANAMREYLAWETDLLARIERDGTCRFGRPP